MSSGFGNSSSHRTIDQSNFQSLTHFRTKYYYNSQERTEQVLIQNITNNSEADMVTLMVV